MINLPEQVKLALNMLSKAGFEAHIVGGCVRDFMLMRTPSDYDITTNALPDQTQTIFKKFKCIDVGKKHGTIAVIINKMQIEITTYRIDGEYTDNRHPKSVSFSGSLKDDLSRRDFTVNALAYNEQNGITDCFNGTQDIENKIIRCVGEPEKRFNEDALRIMRALRFSAQLDFSIEPFTEKYIYELKDTLKMISAERLRTELEKLICGQSAFHILMRYHEILSVFIPEISETVGFEQHSKYHKYTVWEHISRSVMNSRNEPVIRLAMLFHDISKPECFSMDENGSGHFDGHPEKSANKAETILRRLKYDNKTIKQVTTLIKYHDFRFKTRQDIKYVMAETGRELFFSLIEVQQADASSKDGIIRVAMNDLPYVEKTAKNIIDKNECLFVNELDISGNDLIALGISGKKIGHTLSRLLNLVIEEKIENKHELLINETKKIIAEAE